MLIEEFKEKLKLIFPHYHQYYEIIEYKDAFNVFVRDSFGISKMSAKNLRDKIKPSIKTAIDKIDYISEKIKQYHSDKVTVISIEGRKVTVEDEYGVCSCSMTPLLKGAKPFIATAINKKEYAHNMIKKYYTEEPFTVVDISIEKRKYVAIVEKDTHLFKIPVQGLKTLKNLFSIYTVIDKEKYIHEKLLHCNNNYICYFNLQPDFKYTSATSKIIVNTIYGECTTNINTLLNGHNPSILTAVDKTDFFKKALEQKGFKVYDLSTLKYEGQHKKVEIVCEKHGKFKISPKQLLIGQGCKKCGHESIGEKVRNNPPGWSHTSWQKSAEKSKFFDSFKVYLIRCYNENEEFYKLGKTFRTLSGRFFNCNMPYNYEIIKIFESKTDGRYISELEKKLQKQNKKDKYVPEIKFNGMHECFKQVNYEL
jgi:hypothetical protein